MFQDDLFNDYKGELIDEQGNRIFLITSAAHHFSDEVVHYGKHKAIKVKGKVNYGALNHAGLQLFEIHGDPEKVIRVGPSSGLWGEIQVIPGDVWNRIQLNCCCFRIGSKSSSEAEIRVVVLKKDNHTMDSDENDASFKQVYTLRGKVSGACSREQSQHNFLYKKTFDLKIYIHDPFEKPASDESDDETDSDEEDDDEEHHKEKVPKPKHNLETPSKHHIKAAANKNTEAPANLEPIGRICSQAVHEKLKLHLPVLEFPPHISVYDKLTLMGTFFLFNLKI